MQCKDAKLKMSMLLDGELDAGQRVEVEQHLKTCDSCQAEQARWQRIGQELETMQFAKAHDQQLDVFEHHVYARLERGVAWILLSLSAVLLLASGAYYLVQDFLLDASVPMVLRHSEGMNYQQIAEVLGVPTNTVATRLHAARQKLGASYAV